ncbi:MAG: lysylphosphatidylglycerol synthase transmembrane domain-containing protein [Erysipelotrichaceae bacterium]
MKESKSKYLLNFLLIIALTAFAMWFALKDNFNEIMNLLANIKLQHIVVIILWGIFYYVVIGWIILILTRRYKKDYRLRDGVIVAFIGGFFSGITPSATGGQFAQAYILKKQGIKISDGASILWIDFIIYQSVMMLYVSILMLLRFTYYYNMSSPFFILVLLGFIVNGIIIGALWTMAKFPKLYIKLSGLAVKLLFKIHIVKDMDTTLSAWTAQLSSFTYEINKVKNDKKMIFRAVLVNIFRLTLYFALPYYIFSIIGAPIDISLLLDVIAMSSFVSMVNAFFPVPGASGGTEGTFILIFGNVFPKIYCSSVMILWRFATYHMILIIGSIMFVAVKSYYKKKQLIEKNIELEDHTCV